MRLELADVASVIGAEIAIGGVVDGFSVDSRTLAAGDLFFALPGDAADGHNFLPQAFEKGARAAVVDRETAAPGPVLRVANTLDALQSLAAWARRQWGGRVVGVTGSAGKTTTKDAIARFLETRMNVGKTVGNLNNHIGLPLSILRLPQESSVAVLEFGMNHAGEIRSLAAIAQPETGVVTNAGYAHIENFDSPEGVALAKRELIEALPPDGVAVLNADDERVVRFREIHAGRTITFGLSEPADVRAEDVRLTDSGASFRACGVLFETSLIGRHGVRNVLAAIAVAQIFGIAASGLRDAVRSLEPGKMRGEKLSRRGITIYNDCYNSNPDAVREMLDVLRDTPARRRIAVLGEMLELGHWAEPLHRDAGKYAVASGVSVLVGIRGAARHMVDASREAGLAASAAYFFEDPAEAGRLVREIAQGDDAILFKGSRGTRVEKALEAFLA